MNTRLDIPMQILTTVIIAVFFASFNISSADLVEDLRFKITDKNSQIEEIEKEIKKYEAQIATTQKEAKTLSNAIKELDTTRRKLEADIRVTERRIDSITLNIQKLGLEIDSQENNIETNKQTITILLRQIHEESSKSLVEALLAHKTLSGFWSEIEDLETLQGNTQIQLKDLIALKIELEGKQNEAEVYRDSLGKTKNKLSDQKLVAESNKKEKDSLLEVTKNKQSNYENILSEKIENKKIFEEELRDYESSLRIALDPSSVPSARAGVLDWPLDNIIISQYFGDTPFHRANPQIYNGKGHNGVDFATPQGTPLKAVADGVVLGTGDTDLACSRASYGRWVLIEHTNGLTSLYAHMSVFKARAGDRVSRGDTVGYSGNTGHSTGPHLHFTLAVSEGIAIGQLHSKACSGSVYTLPLLTKQGAYLNPLAYFPDL